jgi:glyoxylase-like metal-dependent hydrolase (beta-lactamase superfamily II)
MQLQPMIQVSRFDAVTRFDLARTIAGKGRYWTTCYQLGDTLIDSGCAHTAHELMRSLGDTPPQTILNTHTHEDHIGANGLLQKTYPNLTIYAHPEALTVLHDPRKEQPLQPYRRLFWGWPLPCQAQALSDQETIACGDFTLRALFTPGHSRDHVCYFEESQGWLFSGDLFVGGKDRALGASYDIWGIIRSLKQISELPIRFLFSGSARVRPNPLPELRTKILYLETLGEQVLELHSRGHTAGDIANRLLGPPMWVELVTLGHFSRRHLVRSYLRKVT